MLRLLAEGPQSAGMRRRWSRHRLTRGDDLGQALLEDWTEDDQRPDFLSRGSAWYTLPSPLWDPGAPEEVVEHLLLAARGGDSADYRSWFTGREAKVNMAQRRRAGQSAPTGGGGGAQPPVLVVDELDEARGEMFVIAAAF